MSFARDRAPARLLVVVALVCLGDRGGYSAQDRDGTGALRAGRYEEAIRAFTGQASREPRDAPVRRRLVRALVEVGRYPEAEGAAREFGRANPTSSELLNALGETQYAVGRVEEAEASFRKAIAGPASDALVARLNLAVSRYEAGDRDEATRGFESLVAAYNSRRRLGSEELAAVAEACRHLGEDNPQAFKDALKAYDEAIAADPANLAARVRLAELFLAKYNSTDAQRTLKEALELNPSHPGALIASAKRLDFDGAGPFMEPARRSLEVNPRFVPALVFLAEQALGTEDYPEAVRKAEAALAINPVSLEALSVLAAARHLQDDREGFEDARRRAFARNPRYADLYNTVAELLVRNRFYREATDFARNAVELDPRSWRGHGTLGLNQLRLGDIAGGRKSLEASFGGDPYNVWIKNTLDLLDTFPQYVETSSPRFRFVVHGRESELLSPYLAELAEEAYDRLAERYGYRPRTPIRVEVYPSHADFSVRTVGLAGLGALGVCFGPVVAIDSPSAREVGKFNWGSTLWHELAHVVTLGMTEHRVPRWFTEGLSVLEERRARPGWGDDVSFEFLVAQKAGKLLPLEDLNDGFVNPDHPGRVAISYYQASLVVELIERDYGFGAIQGLLEAYRKGASTTAAFHEVLGTNLEEFDERFQTYLGQQFRGPLNAVRVPADTSPGSAPGGAPPSSEKDWGPRPGARSFPDADDFVGQLRKGRALFEEKNVAEAVRYFERAKLVFPEYAEADSPYWFLALIHKEKGEMKEAAEELTRLTALNENHYRARVELASLREGLGDLRGAAAALEQAVYIYPLEPELHSRLAAMESQTGERKKAIRERQAVVALAPVDRPEALYQLAVAYLEAGDEAAARREVLRALELAPGFGKAQELLLRLHGSAAGEASSGGQR